MDDWIVQKALALSILKTGRTAARRGSDGDPGPEPVPEARPEADTAAALRATLAVLLKTLRPFLCGLGKFLFSCAQLLVPLKPWGRNLGMLRSLRALFCSGREGGQRDSIGPLMGV